MNRISRIIKLLLVVICTIVYEYDAKKDPLSIQEMYLNTIEIIKVTANESSIVLKNIQQFTKNQFGLNQYSYRIKKSSHRKY
jgi:hypothetical protein